MIFEGYRELSPVQRRTFQACFGGWALDALDAQMLSLAIPTLIGVFNLNRGQAGLIGTVTLVGSAVGGWLAGELSDHFGRVRTLQVTILCFSVFTLLTGLSWSFTQILVLKGLQGLGFGGEWAAGAVLLAQVMPAKHRARSLALVQSAWAIGWGIAVLLATGLFYALPAESAWRVMFALGALPAVLVLYIRRMVPEPESGFVDTQRRSSPPLGLIEILRPPLLRATVAGGLLGIGAHGGYYALMTWLPTYLKTERHLSVLSSGAYLSVLILAFWCGCLASAYLLDRIGQRANVSLFAACCAVTAAALMLLPLTDFEALLLAFPLGFFAAGIPASLAAVFSELYPPSVRGAGVGFCYNFGRIVSAGFPFLVGYMSDRITLAAAIALDAAVAYAIAALAVQVLPRATTNPSNAPAWPHRKRVRS